MGKVSPPTPIARSIAAAYGQEIALSEVSEVEELTGLGVKAAGRTGKSWLAVPVS